MPSDKWQHVSRYGRRKEACVSCYGHTFESEFSLREPLSEDQLTEEFDGINPLGLAEKCQRFFTTNFFTALRRVLVQCE